MKMTSEVENLDELNINGISGELIREELLRVVKKLVNSDNVKLFTEHGSKKGIHSHLNSVFNFERRSNN